MLYNTDSHVLYNTRTLVPYNVTHAETSGDTNQTSNSTE
jgi:hypothetical protein